MNVFKNLFSSVRNTAITVLCAVVSLTIIVAGITLAVQAGANNSLIDRNTALRYALADAGLTESDITLTREKLERDDGKKYYEIEFFTSDYNYEYEINAVTGAVADVSIEALFNRPVTSSAAGGTDGAQPSYSQQDGAGNPPMQQGGTQDSQMQQDGTQMPTQQGSVQDSQLQQDGSQMPTQQSNPQDSQSQQGGSQNPQTQQSASQNPPSGQSDQTALDAAKTAALSDAGLTEADVTFTKARLDWEDGVQVYDIEFYTAEAEYKYEINAATGAIVSRETDKHDRNHGQSHASGGAGVSGSGASYIGEDRAREIAVAHAGFSTSDVVFTKTELDEDDGIMEYEVEFYQGRVEYEYSIDAVTGAVLEYDYDK